MVGWPEGYARHILDTVDSTLSEAARLIPQHPGPTWIMAVEQTAARGRRGRAWATPRGNFAGTLVLPLQEPPGQAALRSFITALALFRAFEAVTGRPDAFALKWPNDVLLKGGKVAGILLEAQRDYLVIGIGVNLHHAPDPATLEEGAVAPVSLKGTMGLAVEPEHFLDHLAHEYAALERHFRDQGFAPIRKAWLAQAARLGEVITARTVRDTFVGTFEDVDAKGALILRTGAGRQTITAADVYF
ncbi:MAG: biotin--[acetyl-CoA-carboxylase] ligase [Sulfitobacter sp.]|nr:biotin--[acetyl-CoA-carboxylase] ligase [Sulfitobacter sp.]